MRKNIYAFCLAVFASVFILSCSGNELYDDNSMTDLELGNSNLDIPDQFKIIGEKHNEGLDAAFAAIKSHYKLVKTRSGDTLTRLSKDEYLLIAEQGLKKFCAENVDNYSDEFYGHIRAEMMPKTRAQGETMSPKVYVFVEKMKELLADEPDSPDQLVKGLNEINKAAAVELSGTELEAVYAGTSTCYSSFIYWNENRMKWFMILNNPDLASQLDDEDLNHFAFKNGKLVPPTQTRSWWDDAWSSVGEGWDSTKDYVSDWWSNGGGKEVVSSDAGGAVAGAIGGAIGGSSLAGVGAGPGAIAGGISGGTYSSIDQAIQQWILRS